jgi:cullin-associated NEDD8-dissociated protein 1
VLGQSALQKEALRVLVVLIADGRVAVKKKAIAAIGALIPSSSPKIFTSLAKTLLDALKDGKTHADVGRTYIALVGTLAKSSPARVGGVLKEVMPSIIDVCKADEDEAEGAEEAREVGLQVRFPRRPLSICRPLVE